MVLIVLGGAVQNGKEAAEQPVGRDKDGLPPVVSSREHRGIYISIKLISCQGKNEVEYRAAHAFCKWDGAPGLVPREEKPVSGGQSLDARLV